MQYRIGDTFYERLLSSSNNSGSALGRYCRCCVPLIRGDGPHFSSRIFRGYIVSEIFHRLWQAAQEFACIEALIEHLCATLIHDGGYTSPPVAVDEEFVVCNNPWHT